MIGAIIGDIVGSRFEVSNVKSKDFDLFSKECSFTDDSVMTFAIAKAIIATHDNNDILGDYAVKYMREIGRLYPYCGYGGTFRRWLFSDIMGAYNSFGNGAAMRVSACGFAAGSIEEAILNSQRVTEVTHNHPEGIKGAEATASCIFLARVGKSINDIRRYVNDRYYPLDFKLIEIQENYQFDVSCQGSVPQAITAFLESNGFEDAIRNAISIGGDSDTIAAIAGSIAEAYYGVPDDIVEVALSYLDDRLRGIYQEWLSYMTMRKPLVM